MEIEQFTAWKRPGGNCPQNEKMLSGMGRGTSDVGRLSEVM